MFSLEYVKGSVENIFQHGEEKNYNFKFVFGSEKIKRGKITFANLINRINNRRVKCEKLKRRHVKRNCSVYRDKVDGRLKKENRRDFQERPGYLPENPASLSKVLFFHNSGAGRNGSTHRPHPAVFQPASLTEKSVKRFGIPSP